MEYYDCHNHLLPEVDDGSKSMDESLNSLYMLRRQGVTTAILTPHVNSPYASRADATKTAIRKKFAELKAECEKAPWAYPALLLGCEYCFDPGSETEMHPIPMAGSDVVLLELPYEVDLDGVRRAADIAREHGFRVLLAHPEKYDAFMFRWEDALRFLRENPDVMVQLESWDIGKCNEYSWRFIESRTATVIGTDSHGYHREPSYSRAANALTEWAREDAGRREYAELLLGGNARSIWKDADTPG